MGEIQSWEPVLEQVSREKGVPKDILIEALEEAILKAAKRVFGEKRQLETSYNPETGQVELFQYMEVVEEVEDKYTQIDLETARKVDPEVEVGDELGFQIFYLESDRERAKLEDAKYGDILGIQTARKSFGRIAIRTVQKVIFSKVHEAERNIIYNEYKDRVGELVTGIVRRFERGNVIVDLGKAEGVLPVREQCPRESYRPGDRVQAYLKEVRKDVKGHQLILSRSDPRFVVKLFEKEVPEIYEGIVQIVSVAREPGERTKIAVVSKDSDVDPVGACVGLKGARVQAIVQELKGEKIDIVPYSLDLVRYVCNAIAPAEVVKVLIDEDEHQIELIVPDDQQSLAIGRRGQNVKLASKLLDWKIEVHSVSQVEKWKEQIKDVLSKIEGLDESSIQYLFNLGYHSPQNILQADETELLSVPDMTPQLVEKIKEAMEDLVEEQQQGRAEEASREDESHNSDTEESEDNEQTSGD